MKSLSHVRLLATPWTAAYQAPPSMRFSRQEYWSGVPFKCGDGEDTYESLDCKEIQPVNPKGNQSWIFIGRTDAEVEVPILWPPDAKRWLTGKDPNAGKDWGQEEKGVTEIEMVGWHHQLNGHEFEQILGDSEGQGSLASIFWLKTPNYVNLEYLFWFCEPLSPHG